MGNRRASTVERPRERRLALALIAVLAATAVTTTLADASLRERSTGEGCGSEDNCEACVSLPDCGWCDLGETSPPPSSRAYRNDKRFGKGRAEAVGACLDGSMGGPEGDQCAGLWKFNSCTQEEQCDLRRTCADCLDPDLPQVCGWCDTRCIGIDYDQVPCVDFLSPPDTCQDVDCTSYTDCDLCSAQQFCGWCTNSTGTGMPSCMKGNESGTQEPGSCPAQSWYPDHRECPAETESCDHGDCKECIADPSERCAWCKSSEACVVIGSSDEEQCSIVQATSCDESCEDFQFCNNCVIDVACGWCTSANGEFCVNGDESGPAFNVSCQAYEYDECPSCEDLSSSCDDCFTNMNCEWCFVNQSGQYEPKCLDIGSPTVDKMCLNSTLECSTALPTPSGSPTPTLSKSSSKSIFPTLTMSATMSPTMTMTPSNTTLPTPTATISMSASNTTTPTPTLSVTATATKSVLPTLTHTPARSHSVSHTSTASATMTPTSSTTATASVTATDTMTSTATASATATQTSAASKSTTNTHTPPTSVTSSVTSTPADTSAASATSSPSPTLSPPASPARDGPNWAVLGPLIAIVAIAIVVIALVAAYLFYTRYWKKRWYYMKLK